MGRAEHAPRRGEGIAEERLGLIKESHLLQEHA